MDTRGWFVPARAGQRFFAMFRVTVIVAAALALLTPSVAIAADELSTTDRLDARRFVTAGPRAYEVGTEAGRGHTSLPPITPVAEEDGRRW